MPRSTLFRTHRRWLTPALLLCLAVIALPALAEESANEAEETKSLAEAFAPSVARVNVWLRYDRGEPPYGAREGSSWSHSLAQVVRQRRALELGGYVLAPDRVLVRDLQIHPRFVDRIEVWRAGSDPIPAVPFAVFREQDGVILALERPLEDVKPLTFDASAPPPYTSVYYGPREGRWAFATRSAFSKYTVFDGGSVSASVWANALVTTKDGTAVGVTLSSTAQMDGSWRGAPLDWPAYDMPEYKALLDRLGETVRRAILPVHLRFRSPKKDGEESPFSFLRSSDDEGSKETERDVLGVLIDPSRLLVLTAMAPAVTARLETIEVRPEGGAPLVAEFAYSLKDYGAFLARLAQPLPSPVRAAACDPNELRSRLLVAAYVTPQGASSVRWFQHARLESWYQGWRALLFPVLSGNPKSLFLFTPEGEMVALPTSRRSTEQRQPWDDRETLTMPMAHLAPAFASPESDADLSNVPLSEQQERRLAWLGVEMQALNRELARANEVAHLTRDGKSGALVSFVYPDSPAAKAGIEPGAILLRIHTPERPKPIDVAAPGGVPDYMSDLMNQMEKLRAGFPRGRPWPSVENVLNRQLTSIGFENPFTLEYVVDGDVKKQDFVVTEGPTHFEAALPIELEALGFTVKDLTYEVRRYFQLADDAPGVILAEVERGKPASVAGLVPFEIITHVGSEGVADAAAFAKSMKQEGELELTVKNRTRERIVKIKGKP